MLDLTQLRVQCEFLLFLAFAIGFVQQEPKGLIPTHHSTSSAGADFKPCQGSLFPLPVPLFSALCSFRSQVSFFSSGEVTHPCLPPGPMPRLSLA